MDKLIKIIYRWELSKAVSISTMFDFYDRHPKFRNNDFRYYSFIKKYKEF